MTKDNYKQALQQFNLLAKEFDAVYRGMALRFGLSDAVMWILYMLREEGECTQSELTAALLQPKQTINSALKKMEQQGWLVLEFAAGGRKRKTVRLTEAGLQQAALTVDRLIEAEALAFGVFSAAEQQQFLQLFRRYICSLAAHTVAVSVDTANVEPYCGI